MSPPGLTDIFWGQGTNKPGSIMLVIMTGQRMKVWADDNEDGDRDESEIDNRDSNKMSRTFETQATS